MKQQFREQFGHLDFARRRQQCYNRTAPLSPQDINSSLYVRREECITECMEKAKHSSLSFANKALHFGAALWIFSPTMSTETFCQEILQLT